MTDQPLLGNSPTASERQRLLEQLKRLDEKDEQTLQERESLIGKIVVAGLKSQKLSHNDFVAFVSPLVTKKSDAKKLGFAPSFQVTDAGSSARSNTTSEDDDAQFESKIELQTSAAPIAPNAVDDDE